MKALSLLTLLIGSMFNQTFAAEKDLYDFLWLDPDKQVYVLQNKIHKKEHSIYLNVGYGLGLSSNYQDTSFMHANTGFFLTEEWAIEGLYSSYSNKDNEALINLGKINGSVPFIRKSKSNYGIIGKWSPFYGKINTFNEIFYFDWSFGAGLGKINTESNKSTVSTPSIANRYSNESYNTLILKTELMFHASKNVHIGLGLIMNNFKAPGPTINNRPGEEKMRTNNDAILTIGVSF